MFLKEDFLAIKSRIPFFAPVFPNPEAPLSVFQGIFGNGNIPSICNIIITFGKVYLDVIGVVDWLLKDRLLNSGTAVNNFGCKFLYCPFLCYTESVTVWLSVSVHLLTQLSIYIQCIPLQPTCLCNKLTWVCLRFAFCQIFIVMAMHLCSKTLYITFNLSSMHVQNSLETFSNLVLHAWLLYSFLVFYTLIETKSACALVETS